MIRWLPSSSVYAEVPTFTRLARTPRPGLHRGAVMPLLDDLIRPQQH